jgi:hypothetical protein
MMRQKVIDASLVAWNTVGDLAFDHGRLRGG